MLLLIPYYVKWLAQLLRQNNLQPGLRFRLLLKGIVLVTIHGIFISIAALVALAAFCFDAEPSTLPTMRQLTTSLTKANVASIALCMLIAHTALANLMIYRIACFNPIAQLWRQACLHVGLFTRTNLDPSSDIHEIPQVLKVGQGCFIIQNKGFTPTALLAKRDELSASMGFILTQFAYVNRPDGSLRRDQIAVSYSTRDLPSRVTFDAMPDAATQEITLGLAHDGWLQSDFARLVHIGIAGLTGSGKSKLIRSLILQTLIRDANAAVIGIDFKYAAELQIFNKAQNFICTLLFDETLIALEKVNQVFEERAKHVRNQHAESTNELQFSPILICIDDAALFFEPQSEYKSVQIPAIKLIKKFATQGRFVGVHLIIALQRGSADAMPTQIRSQLKSRMLFHVTQKEDSIVWIETGAGSKLPAIPGRMLFWQDGQLTEIQVPYISKIEVQERLIQLESHNRHPLITAIREQILLNHHPDSAQAYQVSTSSTAMQIVR